MPYKSLEKRRACVRKSLQKFRSALSEKQLRLQSGSSNWKPAVRQRLATRLACLAKAMTITAVGKLHGRKAEQDCRETACEDPGVLEFTSSADWGLHHRLDVEPNHDNTSLHAVHHCLKDALPVALAKIWFVRTVANFNGSLALLQQAFGKDVFRLTKSLNEADVVAAFRQVPSDCACPEAKVSHWAVLNRRHGGPEKRRGKVQTSEGSRPPTDCQLAACSANIYWS